MHGAAYIFGHFVDGDGQTSIMMVIDGLAGNGEEAALSAAAAFGVDCKIVGGAVGDELAVEET